MTKVKDFISNKKAAITSGLVMLNSFWIGSAAFGAPTAVGGGSGSSSGTTSDLASVIKQAATSIYDLVRTIANPIALVALSFCLLTMFFSKNKNTSQEAYSWCKTIIIAFIAINALAIIINWLMSTFQFSTTLNW